MGEKLEAVTRADVEKIEAWLGGYARDPWVPDQAIKRLVRAWTAATPDCSDDALAEEVKRALSDPATVHINMLRGSIAKPSIANIIHLYGADALRAALKGHGL